MKMTEEQYLTVLCSVEAKTSAEHSTVKVLSTTTRHLPAFL